MNEKYNFVLENEAVGHIVPNAEASIIN